MEQRPEGYAKIVRSVGPLRNEAVGQMDIKFK